MKSGYFLVKYRFMKKLQKQVKTLGFKPFLAEFLAFFHRGPDGSRTHVRKQIPFPSTIIVHFQIPHYKKLCTASYSRYPLDTPEFGRNRSRRFSQE